MQIAGNKGGVEGARSIHGLNIADGDYLSNRRVRCSRKVVLSCEMRKPPLARNVELDTGGCVRGLVLQRLGRGGFCQPFKDVGRSDQRCGGGRFRTIDNSARRAQSPPRGYARSL